MENIGRAFSYMFEDKEWVQKILIGAAFVLLSFVIIGIPFVIGYMLAVAKQSAEGKELPLPKWDNLGEKFISGLVYFLIMIIYGIPLAILYFILVFIPCLGWLAIVVIAIGFALITPYIGVRFARTGRMGDAFAFGEIFSFLQKNFVNLLVAWLMTIVFSVVAWFGILALIVGFLFTSFWAHLATWYLYGQVVYEAEKKQPGAALPSGGTGSV